MIRRLPTRGEWRAWLDRQARRVTGLSIEAFAAGVGSGAIDPPGGTAHDVYAIYLATVARMPETEGPR